ncbi:conjugal transfer protein [Xanthomonas campestris]|uniref:conjugal transfer protein n=1 Tax=Xanthomonas campestris TaxID=339 RepID=UPI0002F76474|nr:conjugal transfer protein [Xanthomonas campestris]MEB1028016.1 conjugal transfer protein [Xanthomonas campestris pv. campestris]MEA9553653.1 conjugal transfer protein [Xanthomonas campestris]MEA9597877.1 conjugal transfer protein [Xanthomonas campestris]MEB1101522.1 conjugal transfer protein [Xanthomonas campestris pv. campestris]MEB1136594.1 conjugal transfer protein [Xanthomonas campestris pv. campestris]
MTIRRVTAALTVAIGIAVAGGSAVYAPPAQALVCANCSNLVTQLLQQSQEISAYAKQVQQYKTQLDQLNLQIQQVANEGRNLASLPSNVFGQYQRVYDSYKQSINQLRGSMANLQNTRNLFAQRYPQVTDDATFQQLSAMVDQWQSQGRENVEDALYSGAAVLDTLDSTNQQFETMGQASQSATGALAATQAGNQINMLVGQEMMKLNAQTAAMNQAVLEEQARQMAGDRLTQRNMENAYGSDKAFQKSSEPAAKPVGEWW